MPKTWCGAALNVLAGCTLGCVGDVGDLDPPAPTDTSSRLLDRADVNRSGCVDIEDYLLVVQSFEIPLTPDRADLDVDEDGAIGAWDLVLVVRGFGYGEADPCSLDAVPGTDVGNADIDGSGCVDYADYDLIADAYGGPPPASGPAVDLDGDGLVDFDDVGLWAIAFGAGEGCPEDLQLNEPEGTPWPFRP